MMLKHSKNVQQAADSLRPVSALCFNGMSSKLAVANFDRSISFYGPDYVRRDKIQTRGADKTNKNYVVRALAFSPDSNIMAVAQSDNIIYSYKIGAQFKEKKSICSKILLDSSPSALVWPKDRQFEFVFADNAGRVKLAKIRNHKSEILYDTGSYCVSLALSPDQKKVISGHLDKNIFLCNLETQRKKLLVVGYTVPKALAFGNNIVYAGNDQKVYFLDKQGNSQSRFDCSSNKKIREFTGAFFNPTGDSVVLANFSGFLVFNFCPRRKVWQKKGHFSLKNYYSISAGCWKPDGSQFITSNLCAAMDVFQVSVKKVLLEGGKFEVDFVAHNKLKVKQIKGDVSEFEVESSFGLEIENLRMKHRRYLLAQTQKSLIIADSKTKKFSEILWQVTGSEEFDFSNEKMVLIKSLEEVSIVEFGKNDILGSVRTDFFHKKLISGCISQFPAQKPLNQKISKKNRSQRQETQSVRRLLVYLLDIQTACVLNLDSKLNVCLVEHDTVITGLKLDSSGQKLLFKDSNGEVHLFEIATQKKTRLARKVGFWSWVPNSDVIICHSNETLEVWYSSDNLSISSRIPAKGSISKLISDESGTKVLSLDGNIEKEIVLDSLLIRFNFALRKNNFAECLQVLGEDHSAAASAHWRSLLNLSLKRQNYFVAEKCYAALGDYSKQAFMRKVNQAARKPETAWEVQALIAVLKGQFFVAEGMYIEKGKPEKAVEMYQEMHMWEEAMRVGKRLQAGGDMEEEYIQWLLQSGQELKAAEMKADAKQWQESWELYLKAGMPGVGARKFLSKRLLKAHDVWDHVEKGLEKAKLQRMLGEVRLYRGNARKALNCYIKDKAFSEAIALARKEQPEIIVQLHEQWGDTLMQNHEYETAINHYVEARSVEKAAKACLAMQDWGRAVQLSESLTGSRAQEFGKDLAFKLREAGCLALAEKQFIKWGQLNEAVEMLLECSGFEEAERVCREQNVDKETKEQIFVKEANRLAELEQFGRAEEILLGLNLKEKAGKMYKQRGMWREMLRLFREFWPEKLNEAHILVGMRLESEREWALAEEHFIRGGKWEQALRMYEQRGQISEALRLLSEFADEQSLTQKLEDYEKKQGAEAIESILKSARMQTALIDFLCSKERFTEAFSLAENARHKLEETHLKYALYLENQGKFDLAEKELGKAERWDRAVHMYIKHQQFGEALRVASRLGQSVVKMVEMKMGDSMAIQGRYNDMEQCYIRAGEPSRAIDIYIEKQMLDEAARVAKKFCRARLPEVLAQVDLAQKNLSGEDLLRHARMLEDGRAYGKAIDVYLAIGAEHFSDSQLLVPVWEKAVQLAFAHEKQRYHEVVRSVARKLVIIQRFDLAGTYFENVGEMSNAVENFLKAGQLEQARAVAHREPDTHERERLLSIIDSAFKANLKTRENAEQLISNHEIESGVNVLIKQGQWVRALEVARTKNPKLFIEVVQQFLSFCFQEGDDSQAIAVLRKSGGFLDPQISDFLRDLSKRIIHNDNPTNVTNLKSFLKEAVTMASPKTARLIPEFEKYLETSHFLQLRYMFKQKGELDLHSRVSMTLLSYSNLIPVDRAFYTAGQALKAAGREPLAFAVLNKYLDLYEAIEDDTELEPLNEGSLEGMDLPNIDSIALPTSNFLNSTAKDELRDWLLALSAEKRTALQLTTFNCRNCSAKVEEHSRTCPKCQTVQGETCILSGESIQSGEPVHTCTSCRKKSKIKHFEKYRLISLHCAWCDSLTE